MAKGLNTVAVVTQLAAPVAQALSLVLWDVRFEKEGSSWFLRIFIDKDGGVTIDDCENMSRGIDKLLDEADPIEQSYFLEVSSPGLGRELRKDWHFERFLGREVRVRFIRPLEDGSRDLTARLTGFEKGAVTVEKQDSTPFSFELKDTAFVKLNDDADLGEIPD